jgi:nicotinate-nucleotide pyrophosphorylase (carboxylating)
MTSPQEKSTSKTSDKDLISRMIELALAEDIADGDITTDSLIPRSARAEASLTMKEDGVISGLEIFALVFEQLDKDIVFTPYVSEGKKVKKGDIIAGIRGSYRALLTGERTALNILQRMSGIATTTSIYAKALEGTQAKLLDTRKTAPCMRALDKQAVKAGGGYNHRKGLYDMVMIKDNHIKVAGGITQAVANIKQNCPKTVKIEVETTNLKEVEEALASDADIIMLDNMELHTMKQAVKIIGSKALTEASGNITLETVRETALTGVNYISSGALTHSVKALDISMNITKI